MVTAVVKRDPIVVKIRVKSEEYPNVSKCGLCGGEVERKAVDHPRNVAYDEGWITILLVGLPTLTCKGDCPSGLEFVLEKVVKGLEGTVKRALEAVVLGRDLKTAHLNTSAGEFIGTETPILCTACRYGYAISTTVNFESRNGDEDELLVIPFEGFKCLDCETEFFTLEQEVQLRNRVNEEWARKKA